MDTEAICLPSLEIFDRSQICLNSIEQIIEIAAEVDL